MNVEAGFEGFMAILGVPPAGHGNQVNRRQRRIAAEAPRDLVSVHAAGKPDVAEQDVGPLLLRRFEGVLAKMNDARFVAENLHERAKGPCDVDVVFDDQHVERPGGTLPGGHTSVLPKLLS